MVKAIRLALAAMVVCATAALAGCSTGDKVYYEDDYFTISGFTITQEAEGLYSAEGLVKTKNGAYSESLLADVYLLDKDGNEIAKTVGFANDVPENGSAKFLVALFAEEDFLSKEQVDAISSYEIKDVFTKENLDYLVEKRGQEVEEAEKALRKKYPNENI